MDIQDFVDVCMHSVAEALAGGDLPVDVVTCTSDLEDCEVALPACEAKIGTLATGQTTCWDAAGAVVPCAGTITDYVWNSTTHPVPTQAMSTTPESPAEARNKGFIQIVRAVRGEA